MSFETRIEELLAAERIPTADEMYRMGIEASTGVDGGEVDLVQAHKWFNLAALEGSADAVFYRKQRRIGVERPNLVTEGRDQGTVVFPRAELKFFLDESAQREARAWLRRHRPAIGSAA